VLHVVACFEWIPGLAGAQEPFVLPVLQVFGVGGGGSNAVNNMVHRDIQGIEFWVANTDAQVRS
jgi:cell division GTPase FtsZ